MQAKHGGCISSASRMFITGQKVVCIDGSFPLGIEKFYTALPQQDTVYVVRGMAPAVGFNLQEELAVYLVGLHNPCSDQPPYPERGFRCERFQPLDELTEDAILALTKPAEETVETPV